MHEVADKCVRHKFGPVGSRMRVRKHCVQKKKRRRKRRVNFFSACLGDFFSFYQTRVTSWDQVCLSAFPLVWLQKNLSANVVALPWPTTVRHCEGWIVDDLNFFYWCYSPDHRDLFSFFRHFLNQRGGAVRLGINEMAWPERCVTSAQISGVDEPVELQNTLYTKKQLVNSLWVF